MCKFSREEFEKAFELDNISEENEAYAAYP